MVQQHLPLLYMLSGLGLSVSLESADHCGSDAYGI